jgi:hypothetical protein
MLHLPPGYRIRLESKSMEEVQIWQYICTRVGYRQRGKGLVGLTFFWNKFVGVGTEIKLKWRIVKIESVRRPRSRHYF